jgi:hypothetical protein
MSTDASAGVRKRANASSGLTRAVELAILMALRRFDTSLRAHNKYG